MSWMIRTACLVSSGFGALGCGSDAAQRSSPGYTSDVYSDDAHWICRPGAPSPACEADLDATVMHGDGTLEIERHVAVTDAPVDCFYVYPTVSLDEAAIADFELTEEIAVTTEQAARLGRVCNVYAPAYRQATLANLSPKIMAGEGSESDLDVGYADVLDAWKHYLAHFNEGRRVVLVGHSQGSMVLRRLIREEIDPFSEARMRLVSALLVGADVAVPDEDSTVGGDFQNVPLCRSPVEVGCVATWATFRKGSPPSGRSFGRPMFGRPGVSGCVNPASPAGGVAPATPYFRSDDSFFLGLDDAIVIETPWVALADYAQVGCVAHDGLSYLAFEIVTSPDDPRPDDLGGEIGPDFGWHLADMHLTMGNILELVQSQVGAHTPR